MHIHRESYSERQGHQEIQCQVTTHNHINHINIYEIFADRNIVDASALRDVKDASAYDTYNLPKLYVKQYFCVEAAVHQRVVRFRSVADRRNREPPERKPAATR